MCVVYVTSTGECLTGPSAHFVLVYNHVIVRMADSARNSEGSPLYHDIPTVAVSYKIVHACQLKSLGMETAVSALELIRYSLIFLPPSIFALQSLRIVRSRQF